MNFFPTQEAYQKVQYECLLQNLLTQRTFMLHLTNSTEEQQLCIPICFCQVLYRDSYLGRGLQRMFYSCTSLKKVPFIFTQLNQSLLLRHECITGLIFVPTPNEEMHCQIYSIQSLFLTPHRLRHLCRRGSLHPP